MGNIVLTRSRRRQIVHAISYAFLIIVGVTMLFPFFWMLITSVKSRYSDALNLNKLLPETVWQISANDIRDWTALFNKLESADRMEESSGLKTLWTAMGPNEQTKIISVVTRGTYGEEDKKVLVSGLNQVMINQVLWDNEEATAGLNPEERAVITNNGPLVKEQRVKINRMIIDALFPKEIQKAHSYHWRNYRTVFVEINFYRAILNSFFVTLMITVGQVFTSSLAAYAFARLNFFARDHIFLGYLATLMVPGTVTMIPVFIILRELGWIDTYYALIIPPLFSAYGTFMLRQFFLSLPRAIEEAAILDGCNAFRVYWHVILPLSKPGLSALAILTFIGSWRSFMWPLIVSHSDNMYTLPVALSLFQSFYEIEWTLLMAGSIIMIAPMLLVFIIGQRYFIEGIQLGAVNG
jgi:multiple sugar transport system permease protein